MPRRDRLWMPIDLEFWDHPCVEQAGMAAAVLYQRLIAHALRHERDGWVPLRQPRAWYDDWRERLDALVAAGLVTYGERNIAITDWQKWHEPVTERKSREERRRTTDRHRQRRKRERDALLLVEEQELSTKNRTASRDSHVVSHGVTQPTNPQVREHPRDRDPVDDSPSTRSSSDVSRVTGSGPVARVLRAAALGDQIFRRTDGDPT